MSRDLQNKKFGMLKCFRFWVEQYPPNRSPQKLPICVVCVAVAGAAMLLLLLLPVHSLSQPHHIARSVSEPKRRRIKMKIIFTLFIIQMA